VGLIRRDVAKRNPHTSLKFRVLYCQTLSRSINGVKESRIRRGVARIGFEAVANTGIYSVKPKGTRLVAGCALFEASCVDTVYPVSIVQRTLCVVSYLTKKTC